MYILLHVIYIIYDIHHILYIYIYIYTQITRTMKTMYPPGYHHNGFVATYVYILYIYNIIYKIIFIYKVIEGKILKTS